MELPGTGLTWDLMPLLSALPSPLVGRMYLSHGCPTNELAGGSLPWNYLIQLDEALDSGADAGIVS